MVGVLQPKSLIVGIQCSYAMGIRVSAYPMVNKKINGVWGGGGGVSIWTKNKGSVGTPPGRHCYHTMPVSHKKMTHYKIALTLSCWLTWAPLSNSRFTHSTCPPYDATISAVSPSCKDKCTPYMQISQGKSPKFAQNKPQNFTAMIK